MPGAEVAATAERSKAVDVVSVILAGEEDDELRGVMADAALGSMASESEAVEAAGKARAAVLRARALEEAQRVVPGERRGESFVGLSVTARPIRSEEAKAAARRAEAARRELERVEDERKMVERARAAEIEAEYRAQNVTVPAALDGGASRRRKRKREAAG